MKFLKVALLAALPLALSQTTSAQGPAAPLTLAEAIAWGVDNNLAVAGQRIGVEVAARNNNWVTAGRAPVVQATLGVNNSLNSQNNPASFINGSFYSGDATAGLVASYRLFNGYRVRFDRRRLGQLETQAALQVRQLVEASVFEVARAYYDAQLAAAQAGVAAEVLALSADLVAFRALQREYGQGRATDVLLARTNYLQDSVRVEQTAVATDNALRALYLAMDAADADGFAGRPIADSLLFEPRDWSVERIARRIDSSAEVRLLRAQEQLALTNTELARAALKPSIDLNAGLSHTRTAFKINGENPQTGAPGELVFGSTGRGTVGVQAAYTLWDAGLRRRGVENAIAQERISNLAVRNARRDADLRARNLLATYRTQRQLLALQDLLIANAEANLALADEQLRAGAINSFDYRALQLDYLNAVQARIAAVYDVLVTDLELRRVTGELIEAQ